MSEKFNLHRTLGFVWESSRGWTIASGVLLVFQGVLVRLRYAHRNYQWQTRRTPWERRSRYFY